MELLKHVKKHVLPWLLPRACLICHTTLTGVDSLCPLCEKTLPFIEHACTHCGIPLQSGRNLSCGRCQISPPPHDKLYAIFHYAHPVNKWIHQFKFHQNFSYAKLFTTHMIRAIESQWYANASLPDILIPIPLANSRLRKRGFNQSIELAKPITKHFQTITLDIKNAKRIKKTKPQSSLHSSERHNNIRNAFTINTHLNNAHIAIIDDVVTTGETVAELSRACRKNGARQIDVWCIARTNLHR